MPEPKQQVIFLASPADVLVWKDCAHMAKMNLSQWIRTQLAVGAANPVVRRLVDTPPARPVENPKRLEEFATDLLAKAGKRGKCERRVPAGSFCKSCGSIHAK